MTDDPDPPGVTGHSPSTRGLSPISTDPAEHASRVAREWEVVAETYVQERMRELGIPEKRIGVRRRELSYTRAAFIADERDGGGVTPDGINVDSGVPNPELMPCASWPKARLRDRIDSIIAHEDAEAQSSHDDAVQNAPETALPIGEHARRILREIRAAEPSR